MTDTINDGAAEAAKEEPAVPGLDEQGVAEQLVAQAREKGIELVGPNGLLSQLTKRVLETALEAEMSEHLGCPVCGGDGGLRQRRLHPRRRRPRGIAASRAGTGERGDVVDDVTEANGTVYLLPCSRPIRPLGAGTSTCHVHERALVRLKPWVSECVLCAQTLPLLDCGPPRAGSRSACETRSLS
jgi:hypothetical protein